MSTQTCRQCGGTFEGRADAAYCSPACKQRAYRSRNAPSVTDSGNTPPVTASGNTPPVTASDWERKFREYRAQCDVNVTAHKAKLDSDFATHKAAYDAQNTAINAMRDEERRRYQLGIEVARAKGLITPDDYNLIRSCLHPDSRMSASDEKLAAAFRLFNDEKVKTLLVKEPKPPPKAGDLPSSAADLKRRRPRK